MLGIPEVTVELRNLQARADVYIPQLVDGMNNLSRSIDGLVDAWKTDGSPTATQVVLQLGQLNQNAANVKELVAKLEQMKKSAGLDIGDLATKASRYVRERLAKDGGER